ncbi:MAG: hypothetical protein ACK5NY_08245 [Burkholderiaceae bacterium]|jgi:hypothetical protein
MHTDSFMVLLDRLPVFDFRSTATPNAFHFQNWLVHFDAGQEGNLSWLDISLGILPWTGDTDPNTLYALLISNTEMARAHAMPRWFALDTEHQYVMLKQRFYGDHFEPLDIIDMLKSLIAVQAEVREEIEAWQIAH